MSFFLAFLYFLAAPQVKPDVIKLKGKITDKKSSVKVVLNDCLNYKAKKWEECLKKRLNLLKYEISKSKSVNKGGLTQLILTLKNMKVVRNVYIRGNWPIFESEIMRRVVLRPGTSLPSGKKAQIELFDTQINRIEDYLIREGYFDSKIDIRIKKNGKHHLVDLIVAMDKGPSYKLGKLTIKGNKHLSDQKIESLFRHNIFIYEKPFYKQQFKKDIKKLVKHYRKLGFYAVGVRHNFDKYYSVDHDREKIDITIFIKERRKVTVNFVDRSHASEKELKEVLTFNDSGTYDEVEIRRSAQAIQHLYQTKGYFNAVVYSKSYLIKEDRLKIEFYIQPGDQFRVGSIKFKGNKKLSSSKLRGEIVTKVFPKKLALIGLGSGGYITPKQLEQDKKRLIKLYKKQGYKNVKVEVEVISSKNKIPSSVETVNSLLPRKKKKKYVGVVFKVEEGKQIQFKNLQYQGVKASDLKALKKTAGVSKNVPFSKNMIKQDLKKFGRYFANNGYPYNTITTNISTDQEQKGVNLKYQIKYGPRVKFGSIFIKGNFKTRDSVVKRELAFDEGDDFSLSSVEKTARNLRSLGVFRSVRVKFMGLDDKQKIVHVIIQLIERYDDSGELEVGGGFSTDNLYFASLSYKNHNLFGLAKSIELKGEVGAEIQSGRLTFQDSRFLGTNLLFQISGYGRSEETVRLGDIITYGASITLRKSWSQRFQWFLRYVIRHVSYKESLYRVGGGADESSRVNFATTTASIGPTIIWDKRDNPLVPRKGYRLTSSVRVASKYLGGDDDFFHINLTGQIFINLPFKFILAQGFRYDHGIPFRNTNVLPKVERFFAGGDTTVRGYEEDQLFTQLVETPISPYGSGYVYSIKPVGGNIRLLSNTELQFPIWEKSILLNMPIWGAFFFDTGYLVNSYQNLTLGIFHSGYGAALRVVTPVGVISIEYALPLKRVWGNDPDGRVHFNFGFIF